MRYCHSCLKRHKGRASNSESVGLLLRLCAEHVWYGPLSWLEAGLGAAAVSYFYTAQCTHGKPRSANLTGFGGFHPEHPTIFVAGGRYEKRLK